MCGSRRSCRSLWPTPTAGCRCRRCSRRCAVGIRAAFSRGSCGLCSGGSASGGFSTVPTGGVYFEQVPIPGREAAFDFTGLSDLGVTLRGVAFPHLLFEWVLSYSRWTYVGLALSETFEALVSGLRGALWTLGAVPAVLRHDNLSAATHKLRRSGGRQLTARFRQVLDHYGLLVADPAGEAARERGGEQSHFRTATAIEQALLLRGGRDFVDEAAYPGFVRMVVGEERNAPAASRLAGERPYLRPLPSARVPEYTTFQCRVRKWSTIRVGGRVYSVPSRLIGHTVETRRHPSAVEVLYGGRVVCTMPAAAGLGGAPYRLPPHHRELGPEAGRVRAVSLPGGAVPVARVSGRRMTRSAGRMGSGPTSSTCACCTWRPRPASGGSRRRFAPGSTPAPPATTPPFVRRFRPSPWSTFPARIWRSTTRC